MMYLDQKSLLDIFQSSNQAWDTSRSYFPSIGVPLKRITCSKDPDFFIFRIAFVLFAFSLEIKEDSSHSKQICFISKRFSRLQRVS